MLIWHCRIGAAAVGWIALTLVAVAQSGASHQDMPTGDVWIAPDGPSSAPRGGFGKTGSANPSVPTGDVWLAPDGITRTVQPNTLPQQAERETDFVNNGSPK